MLDGLLASIDGYLDAVPRPATRVEEIGPFTLFVNEGIGWRYYARPTVGAERFTSSDVQVVLDRQRELDQPLEFEWLVDVTPGVGPATESAGLRAVERPLMHLAREDFRPHPVPEGALVRFVEPGDDLARITAVAMVGFDSPGTDISPIGTESLAERAARIDAGRLAFNGDRIARELTITAVAFVEGHPVASGSHQPMDGLTEIVGVACLPAFRRRGLGAAVTSALARDAFQRQVGTVFLSADDESVARIYGRLGFRTIGRVGAAAPP
jgi:ribosomal protein S18 acetylase RimI-like enzyme